MSWFGRILGWLFNPILSRPMNGLDRVLAITDGKITGSFRRLEAAADSAPRHRFTATEVPMRELAFGRMRLPEIRRLLGVMPGLMRRMLRSGRYYRPELPSARTPATKELLAEVESAAMALGAIDIAYLNEVQAEEIFQGLALPAPGAIVFTVEMEAEAIAKAPSFDTFHEVAWGYRRLAEIAEAICDLLQSRGHAAFPGTALGGQTDYVALAKRAGLGGIGFHGLLLTPKAGSRVRIATVYTNLSELPERGQTEHEWVQDFCRQCRMCVRSCPPQAIHPGPRRREDGQGTACIDHVLCRDYFAREFGCAKCIAVCPFSTAGYETIRKGLGHVVPGLPAPVDDRDFRVAVVGAGAAGFYVSQALLERTSSARIDLLERLPMPHGLVRYGVAPDHPEVRSKSEAFDDVLGQPRTRLLANVGLGRDVTRKVLLQHYDAVVYATGAPVSRNLGIEGEHLYGSVDALSIVGWYNGHPDHVELAPRLDHSTAVIVGAGNVALDVARVLLSPLERLSETDIAEHAMSALAERALTRVFILVRRGPADATFTPRELRDLAQIPGVTVKVHAKDLAGAGVPPQLAPDEARRVGRNLELLESLASQPPPEEPSRVEVHLRFYERVTKVDDDGHGRVGAVRVRHADGTESRRDCGLLVRAIGMRGEPLPGVPFDTDRGVIPSQDGRVVDAAGRVCPGEYTSGWVRRGAQGIIGASKVDAEEVAGRILDDLPDCLRCPAGDLQERLLGKGVRVVTAVEWDRLRREERLRGSRKGRAAIRRTRVDDILASLETAAPLGGPP